MEQASRACETRPPGGCWRCARALALPLWLAWQLAGGVAAAPQEEAAPGEEGDDAPVRVLVYTLAAGAQHEVTDRPADGGHALAEQVLVDLGVESGAFEAHVSRSADALGADALSSFGAVVFFTSGELPLEPEQRAGLLAWVAAGGAFVGVHSAGETLGSEPGYAEMLGGVPTGSVLRGDLLLRVEDREHPAASRMGETLELPDEVPRFGDRWFRERAHVILSLDSDVAAELGGEGPAGDIPVAWCRLHGAGRVFYTALGHRAETWEAPAFRDHLLGGIRWALGQVEGSSEPSTPPPRPELAPGWEAELIDRAPELRWPSAVHCLRDGSLLVAEDPMDMPGPADEPIDRIWRYTWTADGGYERTLFAEDLYAVFGLQEIDGAVFVMNMPYLTVLRDDDGDGVAESRRELLSDLGPPAPGAPGGFNDHIVTGLRLGMDGFLYVSVGDKGVPGATGTDGSQISLRGGGVVRLRPDGSELEVVASGTRNHLDVAMDSRGALFTYDNTDDGLGWWTRVTHIVRGGYYGYPWDYGPHPERHLPAMVDFGGGSPCGGLAYRGGAWGPEFADDLFYCEWGKGVLRRIDLEPDGGTFRVAGHEDVMKPGSAPGFKPLDVCTSPDGRFLYVADWGYPGWRKDDVTGRLWRLRRAGDDGAPRGLETPARGWSTADLDAPGFRERLGAQRALAARGPSSVSELTAVALDATGAPARRHAVWALGAIGSDLAIEALHRSLGHPDADTRAQTARALGAWRRGDPWRVAELLSDPSPVVRGAAARALGRLGEHDLAVPLLLALRAELGTQGDATVRFALRAALADLGAWGMAASHLGGAQDALAAELGLLLRGARDPRAVEVLADLAGSGAPPERRAQAVALLAELHRGREPWDGRWWGTQPARTSPPARTVDWEGTDVALAALRAALDDGAARVRAAALDAVVDVRDEGALPAVRARFGVEEDPALLRRALDVLAALEDPEATPLIAGVLADAAVADELFAGAVEAAGRIASPEAVSILAAAARREDLALARVVQCVDALARAGDEAQAPLLVELLTHGGAEVRVAAAEGLGRLRAASALAPLLALVDDPAAGDAAVRALAEMPDAAALPAFLRGLESERPAVRGPSRRALLELADGVRSEVEALAERGELSATALGVLREIYSVPRPLLAWSLRGPYRAEDPAPRVEESGLVLADDGLEWLAHRAGPEHGHVDLLPLFDPDQNVAAWARATVSSGREREAEWSAGSDDSLRVWVNGALVHGYPGDRGWAPAQDHFRAPLRAGENEVVLEVRNSGGAWGFSLEVSEPQGGPLFAEAAPFAATLEDHRAAALAGAGDAARGRAVFFDPAGPGCFRCHVVAGEGVLVGPDLTGVGGLYPREELVRSVLEPSARIREGYRAEVVELDSGRLLSGLPLREEEGELVLAGPSGEELRVRLDEVVERTPSPLSAMPSGLQSGLGVEQFADLVAFLEGLVEEK